MTGINDKGQYTVKALVTSYAEEGKEDAEIIGFLEFMGGKVPCVQDEDGRGWEVNPYSICRNTGIKIQDTYLFEADLVEWSTAFDEGLGIVAFSESEIGFALQRNFNYSGSIALKKVQIKRVVGNVLLSNADAHKFQEYSDREDAKYSGIQATPATRSGDAFKKRCSKEALSGAGIGGAGRSGA